MQWLLNAPAEFSDALVRHGHKVHLADQLDPHPDDLLQFAAEKQWDVMTTDAALAMSPFDGRKPFGRCIVYLQSGGADSVDRLFERFNRLSPGWLYTVTGSRVKVRQLPTKGIGLRTED